MIPHPKDPGPTRGPHIQEHADTHGHLQGFSSLKHDRQKKHFISPPFPSPVCCISSICSFPSLDGHLSLCPSHPRPAQMSTPPSFSATLFFFFVPSADSSGRDKVLMLGLKVTAPVLQPRSWGARDPSPLGIPRALWREGEKDG